MAIITVAAPFGMKRNECDGWEFGERERANTDGRKLLFRTSGRAYKDNASE